MKVAFGPEAKQAMVAVAGGMYMEHRKIRTTKLNGNITHMELRDKILQLNKANQKKCGVTYRDPESRAIIPIDLVNGLLLSSCYIAHHGPRGHEDEDLGGS